MIDFTEIRKRVAMENEIIIPENDPALLVVKMNALVMGKYVEILNEQNEAQQQAFINAVRKNMADGVAESKKIAGRIVTDGAEYVSEQANMAITSALEDGLEAIRKELGQARKEVESARKAAFKMAAVSSLCAVFTVGAVIATYF